MKSEIVAHEVDWHDAWQRAARGDSSEVRLVPITLPDGEPALVHSIPIGGLSLMYHNEEISLLLGNTKMTFAVEEWQDLTRLSRVLVEAGRINAVAQKA